LDFLCNLTKPNLSNWIVVPTFSFDSSNSPSPFLMVPSGIVISVEILFGVAGSQCRNFVFMLLSGFLDMNENVLGFSLSTRSDLKFNKCISL